MSKGTFEVFVSDYASSVDEWRRAMNAPSSELPKLDAQQREVARKFGISEEEYARSVLAGCFGEERMRTRARGLGELVERVLEALGPDYRLDAVKSEMFNGRWILRIETPEKVANVTVSRELVDDVLDSGAPEELERLKASVLTGLGKRDLIVHG